MKLFGFFVKLFGFFVNFFGIFFGGIFWIFLGFFLRTFLGGFFFGRILLKEFFGRNYLVEINKPERVFGLQVRCRELDVFKILEIFEKLFGNFLDLLGNFLGGIFWKEFFVYIGIDLYVKILVFVKILSQ